MITLTNEDATYVRWKLDQSIAELRRAEAAARRRADSNLVAKRAETYLADALYRAQAEMKKAYQGVNANKEMSNG